MLPLYNAALGPLRLALALWARRPLRDPESRTEWRERRGLLPPLPPGGVWIHGASVGEARIVRALAASLRAERPALPLAVSATTRTGRLQLPRPPLVEAAFFAPLDLPGLPRRALGSIRPALLALVETELWPNLLSESRAAGVARVVVNARLSVARMTRYRRWARLFRPLVGALERVGAQSQADAARFLELGASPRAVVVTGNVKWDLPVPTLSAAALRERLGLAPERPVFVAGSTGQGEEGAVLAAFDRARSLGSELLLLLAPRRPERIDEVWRLAASGGRQVGRLSRAGSAQGLPDVLIVDTVGELPALYQLASVAFVGGTLIPLGGHNVLEPAAVGVPVLFGPSTEGVGEQATALLEAHAAARVTNPADLAQRLCQLLASATERRAMGQRGQELVRSNRGALARTTALVLETLP
jgi:3-deoxy-D-manno-octulosonic-acid transferase